MSSTFSAPLLDLAPTWDHVASTLRSEPFATAVLPAFIRERRWFAGKAWPLRRIALVQLLPLGSDASGRLALLRAEFLEAAPEIYLLPLQLTTAGGPASGAIARFRDGAGERVLVDAMEDAAFRTALFQLMRQEKRLAADDGELIGICGAALRTQTPDPTQQLPSRVIVAEQSNSSALYDGRFFLKLYRKPESGENPDAELLRFLSEQQHFAQVPAFCGAIEWQAPATPPRVLGLLVAHVENQGDAWAFTLAELAGFYARVRAGRTPADAASPEVLGRTLGDRFPARAQQLGVRTAQMHLAFSADAQTPQFAPERFTAADLRTWVESMAEGTRRMCELLGQGSGRLPESARAEAAAVLARKAEILQRPQRLLARPIEATRTRHHGDYHLGQVLVTVDDLVILDFEGEPARSLSERRMKRTPLRDVAGMLRSFHYAAHTALGQARRSDGADDVLLAPWAERWAQEIGDLFLGSYLATASGAPFLPQHPDTLTLLLEACLLEKATYEVCYELNNRPDWAHIPLRGIARILDGK